MLDDAAQVRARKEREALEAKEEEERFERLRDERRGKEIERERREQERKKQAEKRQVGKVELALMTLDGFRLAFEAGLRLSGRWRRGGKKSDSFVSKNRKRGD